MTTAPGRCALIGAAGQLGFDLARTFDLPGELFRLTRADLDILDRSAVERILSDLRPTLVVNTAAYNRVDRAEDDGAAAFGTLADVCGSLGATLAHFSTDYVFDGHRAMPYGEDDAPAPLSAYGRSKLEGERAALTRCPRAFVFRVCGLFGVGRGSGKDSTNFVETMLRL